MGLASNQEHILGRQQKFFVNEEASPGVFAKPASGDAMNVLATSFAPNIARKDRTDAYMATRDVLERITGKSEHSWSAEAYYVPSGTKNTPPDCGSLIAAAMGLSTVPTPGTDDVTYTTGSNQTLMTFSLIRQFQDLYMEALAGAWVESMTLTFSGGEEPKIKFEGGAMDYAATGYSTLNGALSGGETVVNIAANGGVNFHDPSSTSIAPYARSVVSINGTVPSTDHEITDVHGPSGTITAFADAGGGDVNATSVGHGLAVGVVATIAGTTNYNGAQTITAVPDADTFTFTDTWVATETGTWTADAVTLATAVSGSQADASTVTPYVPTHTDAGSPIAGITGALTWDSYPASGTWPITSFELTIKNNLKAMADHAFLPHTNDVVPGFRDISGKFTTRVRQDFLIKLLARRLFDTKAISVWAGGAAKSGTRVEVDAGYCELGFAEVAVPESEEATVDFTFKCLGSSGNDALTIKHT